MNTQETTEVRYSDEDLTIFKTNIEKKLETANKELEYLNSRIVKDMPEKEQLQFQQLATRQQSFIDNLTAAQERIENGTYGICRVTGKLIDKDRLMAVPHATLSLEAKAERSNPALINPDATPAPPAGEKKPRKSKQKKDDAGIDTARYPDEDLRNFKTLIGNKIDEANEEVKFLQVVLADRNRGIKVDGYEDMSPADVEALIESKKSYINELEQALDRLKKKTFGIDEVTGQLIPKETLLRLPVIRRIEGTPEQPSTVITHDIEQKPVRKCRVCGCTEDDCSQCIEKTGQPCHWVEEDLCSACADEIREKDENAIDSYQAADEPQTKNTEKKLSAEELEDFNKIKTPRINGSMNFFTQLAGHGNVDLTLRIMQKNGKLTMRIDPGIGSALLKPINVTGTPEEFDEEFFTLIVPKVQEIKGLVTNLDEVKKEAEQKKDEKAKAPIKPAATNKSKWKSPVKKSKPAPSKSTPKKQAVKKPAAKKKAVAKPQPEATPAPVAAETTEQKTETAPQES